MGNPKGQGSELGGVGLMLGVRVKGCDPGKGMGQVRGSHW